MTEIDPRLSQLYRETSSTEVPSPVLDAAILAAARQREAKLKRREQPWWSRWMLPASLMATLVLGVSITLLIEREHPEVVQGETTRAVPPMPVSPSASATVLEKTRRADEETAPAAVKKVAPAAAAPVMPAEMPAAEVAEPVRPAAPKDSTEIMRQAKPTAQAAPPAHTLKGSPATADATRVELRAKAPVPRAAQESNIASDVAAGGAQPAPMSIQEPVRSAKAWLDDIRRLKREGREKEAAEQLSAFRKVYPDIVVPADLDK